MPTIKLASRPNTDARFAHIDKEYTVRVNGELVHTSYSLSIAVRVARHLRNEAQRKANFTKMVAA